MQTHSIETHNPYSLQVIKLTMQPNVIEENFLEAQQLLNLFIKEKKNLKSIKQAGNLLVDAFGNGHKVMACGNGGSMCDAMHFAEELTGRFRENRKPLPAISLSDVAHISCVSNDYGYDEIFSRQVDCLGATGDVLLAISTSGNSPNILKAVEVALSKKMKVIGLVGKHGGKLAEISDVAIQAPYSKYSDRAQEIHIKVIHSLIHFVETELPVYE